MDSLKKLTDKEYIKNLNGENVDLVAGKIRKFIVDNVLKTGGHLASNLGVVELTLAIHKVFDFPKDKIIFDVGHQCYVHKILSGRYDKFSTLRKINGISGFPKSEESEYDSFNTGHSSTSISAALGMARARDLKNEDYNIISFIGDGSIGGGMAFEALNDTGASDSKIIIILNDNEMSINQNVGGLSSHLSMLRLNKSYLSAKSKMHKILDKTGIFGALIEKLIKRLKNTIKFAAIHEPMFEKLGITYIGLIDGHDFDAVTYALEKAKNTSGPVIVHTVTKKGKGYYEAEANPSVYHGVSPEKPFYDVPTQTYTDIFGEFMLQKAKTNNKIVSITAAMSSGCGLTKFSEKYPNRFFDVGIAEQHAVTMAAGMAKCGMTPVFSVYSTFLQRAYDQILHDVCMQNLHVVFAIDRAGIVGEDGETHQGTFDFSYLVHLPNMTVLAPSCKEEFIHMLNYATDVLEGPVAIRFPKAIANTRQYTNFEFSKLNSVKNYGNDIVIFSVGRMYEICDECCEMLKADGFGVHLVNVGTVKPLDSTSLNQLISKSKITVTVEDNIISGGAGEYIASKADKINKSKIINIGFDDTFIKHGTQKELFDLHGISPQNIADRIKKELINL